MFLRSRLAFVVFPVLLGAATVVACSEAEKRSGFDGTNGSSGGTGSSGGFGTQDGGANIGCAPNKDNYDIPGNNCDDDDDGTADNPPSCDDGIARGGDAEEFAKAIGICTMAADKGYGLVKATYTKGYNRPNGANINQHGILPKFGDVITPREGTRIGVLSTGYAGEYNGSGTKRFNETQDWSDNGSDDPGVAPPSFPKPAQDCPIDSSVYDLIAVKLELKAPRNGKGVKFDFNFFTSEWPGYVCSKFNDSFIAFLTAEGFNNGLGDNISFDANNNPLSVNNNFFDRCTPNVATGCQFGSKAGTSTCAAGPAELAGTGFGATGQWCAPFGSDTSTAGGATGWLTTQAPVTPGETFTLEFMIWDTGDGALDSSVLIDNFTWSENQVAAQTDRPK